MIVHPHREPASSSEPSRSPAAAARPCRTPRWKLAKRSLVADADRAGTGASLAGAAVPGTRLACGTRFGSPAIVVPPVAGELAAAAASQPSSAADAAHVTSGSGWAGLTASGWPGAGWLPGGVRRGSEPGRS